MNHVNDPKWTAFVLGELEAPDKEFIEEVLERDPSALETVERLREISALIEDSLKDLSPLELSASQREEILAASSGAASPKKWFYKPRRIRWVLAAAATAMVIFVAGLMTMRIRPGAISSKPEANTAAKVAAGTASVSQNVPANSDQSGAQTLLPWQRSIVMFDRTGKTVGEIAPAGNYYGFRLSPDGKLLAVDRPTEPQSRDVWLFDLARRTLSRLTFGGGSSPVWSPDGRAIAFTDPATGRLYKVYTDGSGPQLALSDAATAVAWSADGRLIAFERRGQTTGWDLWLVSASGGVPSPLLQTPFNEQDAHFSPDGRWFAFSSDETARQEIYVRRFGEDRRNYVASGTWQVSTSGGVSPRWSLNGRELFYLAPGGRLMSCAVDLTNSSDLRLGPSMLLFQVPSADTAEFEVTPDGHFILFGRSP